MFVKPSISPKLIPGPPVYDAVHPAITGEPSQNQSGITSAVQTIIGGSNSQMKPTVSLTTLFTENITKMKKFPYRADWGENNLVAYCCQNYVVVVDPTSVQLITTLYGHKTMTCCVSWCGLAKIKGIERANSSVLASGDERGMILVWEAKKARKICAFVEDSGMGQKRSIIQMKWMHDEATFLVTLSSSSTLSLWNIPNRSRVWKIIFEEVVTGFSLDPFTNASAVLPSENGWVFVISDFNIRSTPEQVSKRLQVGAAPTKQGTAPQTMLKDFVYSPHMRNQAHIVARREVTTYDLLLKQSVVDSLQGRHVLRGGKSDFRKLFTMEEDGDLMYSLHDDGTIGAWEYNPKTLKYESSFCDVVRGSKHGADRPGLMYSVCFSPHESKLAAVSADGKLWVWELLRDKQHPGKNRWLLQGLLETIPAQISSMQVSPSGTEIAIGTQNGFLLIFDLLSGGMKLKHEMFNLPVQGVRWYGPHNVVCFSSKKNSSNYTNHLIAVNLLSGKHTPLRREKADDSSYLRAIRVSYSQKYLIVLCKDRPIEVWSLETLSLMRILPFTSITALEWCPPRRKDQKVTKELFFFTSTDGSLHFYRIEGDRVIADTKKPKIFAYNQICSLAWKGDYLVSGDTVGNINYWELANKRARTFASHRGLVRRIQFSPEGHHILVLFAEGDFGVWDLDQGNKLAHSPPNIKAVSIDWAAPNYPVIASTTGSVMIFDLGLSTANSSVLFHSLEEPMQSPAFLPSNIAQYLRACIENNMWSDTILVEPANLNINPRDISRNAFGEIITENASKLTLEQQIMIHRALIPPDLLAKVLDQNTTTAERCLLSAKYFGDKTARQFWTLAIQYLDKYSATEETKHKNIFKLPVIYDILRDNTTMRQDEIYNIGKQNESVRKSNSASLYSKVAQSEALLNNRERAVNLLLETPPDHADMYVNFLHACVIAASNRGAIEKDHFYQTVLFVASTLISQQKDEKNVDTGVELMILIGEGVRACKTLQDFDQWEKAARIARCVLDEEHSRVIISRWADHLTSNGQLMKSIGLWLSLGLFREAIDLLHKSELDDIAALFARACSEYRFDLTQLHKKTVLNVIQPSALSTPSYNSEDVDLTTRKLLYFTYQQYGTFLARVGNEAMGKYYSESLISIKDIGLLDAKKAEELPKPSLEDDTVDEEDLVVLPTQEEELEIERSQGLVGSGGDLIEFEEKSNEQQAQQSTDSTWSFL